MEIVFIHPTPDGSEEIALEGGRISFGRGSEAIHRFADDGLSRLHSSVYREGERIWIVDENSTNGTFVNGEKVGSSGTPLFAGDLIKIGNYTSLKVKIIRESAVLDKSENTEKQYSAVSTGSSSRSIGSVVAIGVIAAAFLVISVSAVFIGYRILVKEEPQIVKQTTYDDPEKDGDADETPTPKGDKTPKETPKTESGTTPVGSESPSKIDLTEPTGSKQIFNLGGRKYLDLPDAERRKYIEIKLERAATAIGNRQTGAIPSMAIDRIKKDVDGYANRIRSAKKPGTECKLGDNLQATYERASKNAPFISRSFKQEGIDSQIGLYIAMIESEHCSCVQSGTGPLGMFQFTYATGKTFFDDNAKIVKGSSPTSPDDRCNPQMAARASARYVKYLMGWYGTGPSSVPLAIASYNSGEGGMRKNLKQALESDPSLSRDFWTLIANTDKLTQQFKDENFMYPPKFFAAAIVGENPQDFGLSLQPLSTYTSE